MSNTTPGTPGKVPQPLPCPFCGSKPELLRNLTSRDGSKKGVYTSVRCPNSGCAIWKRDLVDPSKLTPNDSDAILAWNQEVKKL